MCNGVVYMFTGGGGGGEGEKKGKKGEKKRQSILFCFVVVQIRRLIEPVPKERFIFKTILIKIFQDTSCFQQRLSAT